MRFIFLLISFSKLSRISLIFWPYCFLFICKIVLFNVFFGIFLAFSLAKYIILFFSFFWNFSNILQLISIIFSFFCQAFYNCAINDSLIFIFSVYYFAFPSNIFFGYPLYFALLFFSLSAIIFLSFESFAFLYTYQSL